MNKFDPKARGAWSNLVNKMTNHERNQWARKGYPGHRKGQAEPKVADLQQAMPGLYATLVRRITGFVSTISDPLRTE